MKHQLEKTEVVVADLFQDMESTVTAYGPGVIRATRLVDGTAFFPGGIGLWRGLEPHGETPFFFPKSPIMILGHNFDKVAALEASWLRGIGLMDGPTWLVLRRYLEAAEVDKLDCFFTNVFVGLQPIRSIGNMVAAEEYKEQCRTFLHKQIKRVKPRIVVILGIPAAKQFHKIGCQTPSVQLNHPYYAFAKGRDGEECASIVVSEAAKLRRALNTLNSKS
jgi:uracil-DNA glycosylase family 4